MFNLKEMSNAELKQYLATHRNDDDAFSEALQELMSRSRDRVRYPANLPLEEMEKLIAEKLNQSK
ncbi:DUF6887 family protein [Merismopedia glauca]|uniref:Uncharacterized protein n=1 Tax=Merismopedia glauca CCAP 1448/3 TaxID=1296344 RepID=A0A2T1C318_9CYAN|nr:hypothetical protein [Merismopedia glauca]PSB02578.1 hypothetical protein C7B64_12375 [Merismopedia glauca CCAP 1448/3]